jgi:hypothetical protein
MKYIITFTLLLTSLCAHTTNFEGSAHLHFFNSLHIQDFVLFIMILIASLALGRYFFKKSY